MWCGWKTDTEGWRKKASLRVRAIELMGDRDEKGKQTIDLLKRIAQIDQNREVRQAAIELLEEMGMGN